MLKIYELIGDIRCVEISVTITPARRIERLEGWIGVHIRNMLLAATNEIICDDRGSLMDIINGFPIKDYNHPWHKELKGGFPKGYSIKILSETKRGYTQNYERNEPIRFAVTLIGAIADYADKMVEAIALFAARGIHGHMEYTIDSLDHISLYELLNIENNEQSLSIDFITPLSLFNNKKSIDNRESLRLRMNGFVPIYQLVTSAVNRVAKMAVLYGECCATANELALATEEIANIACGVMLHRCDLRHTELSSAKRRATKETMVFDGLIGKTEWSGDTAPLYPLLKFCSHISLGDNVVYGMGNMVVSYRV